MRKYLVISLIVSSCMVGPNYETPVTTFVEEYDEPAIPEGAEVDLRTWWTQFNDPILNEMIDEAIRANYDLRLAAEHIAQVRATYQLSAAKLWPEIDLVGSTTRNRISQSLIEIPNSGLLGEAGKLFPSLANILNSLLGQPLQDLFIVGFDAFWELDFFGKLRREKEAAKDHLEASVEDYRNIYIALLADVSRYYSAYRTLQAKIQVTQEQIDVYTTLWELSTVLYNAGLRSDLEPLTVEAELENIRTRLPPLERAQQQVLYSLAVLLGRQPENISESWLAMGPIPQAAGRIPIGVPSDLLRRRPDIREAERLLAAETALVGARVAELFPSFNLNGNYGYESVKSNNWFKPRSRAWSVGPNVFWPTIDFGRTRDMIDEQSAVQREALAHYEQTILLALQDVENSLVSYIQDSVRLEEIQRGVDDLKEVCDLFDVLYKAGLSSISEFFEAEASYLLAKQDLIDAQGSLSTDLIAIYKSLGGDWECSDTP